MSTELLARLLPGATAEEVDIAEALIGYAARDFTDPPSPLTDHLPLGFLQRHRVLTVVPDEWIPDEQRQGVRERVESILLLQMRLEWATLASVRTLDRAGIENRVLKGMASAHLDYPRPELRHAGDVDLLVPSGSLRGAAEALLDAGYELLPDQSLLRWSRGLTVRSPNGSHIDLHSRLFHRTPRRDRTLDDTGEPTIGDEALALRHSHRLTHAAAHVIATIPSLRRLSGLIDVAVLARDGEVRADAMAFARDLRVERVVDVAYAVVDGAATARVSALERRAFLGTESSRFDRELWHHGLRLAWRGPAAMVAGRRGTGLEGSRRALDSAPSTPASAPDPVGEAAWRCNPAVRSRSMGDRLLLFEPQSGEAVSLDGTGPLLWRLLHDPATIDDLLGNLPPGDDRERRRTVRDFVHDLAQDGFVEAALEPHICR